MAAAADTSPTCSELRSADVMRPSASSSEYQRREGPVNGGTGTVVAWKENSTSEATGRKMKA